MAKIYEVVAGAAFYSLLTCAVIPSPLHGQNAPVLQFDRLPPAPAFLGQTRAPAPAEASTYRVETIATGLDAPWSLAFLPDGTMLVTERAGRIHAIDAHGTISPPLSGLPAVRGFRDKGLTDIVLAPEFEQNRLLYFTYYALPDGEPGGLATPKAFENWSALSPSEQADNPFGIYRIARARLAEDGSGLENVEVIFQAGGRRLVHGPDGTLLATMSGAQSTQNSLISEAQDLSALGGKVHRINRDGSIPEDNPFIEHAGALASIYSLGHRDPEGAAINPSTGELWMVEHGPRGGDELNIIRSGNNYGWPMISYGNEYTTAPIGEGLRAKEGMEQPVYFWVPSIAPSGMLFYTGDLFPEWRGNLFVGALAGEHLVRLVLDGDRVVAEERLLVGRGTRIRDVRQGPDGAIYLLTSVRGPASGSAELLKVVPE